MHKKGLKVVLIFIGAYLIFLPLWINIKDYYGYAITYSVSNMVTPIKDVMTESITRKGDKIDVIFSKYTYRGEIKARTSIKTSFYTFKVLSTFLCEFLIGQFFEKRQVVTHFSYWV